MWVYLKSFSFPYEAQIIKSRLNAEGIEVHLENENIINMNWLYSNALGGVKLYVNLDKVLDARSIIEQDFSDDLVLEFGEINSKCPNCQSYNNETYVKGTKIAFLTMTVLNFLISKIQQCFICSDCKQFFH